jgi:hypothetical protein
MPGPNPEALAKNGTEDCHQAALFCWSALPETQQRYPELAKLLFAIPNGGERNKIVAAKLKATGVKAGVHDIFLAVPRKLYHGMFIELKKIGGKPSEQQVAFMQAVTERGFAACIVEGWLSARDAITSYLDQ